VKRLVITPKGTRLSDEIIGAVFEESPVFNVLDEPEQRELLALLTRLVEAPVPRATSLTE
jgi:hypothetical protein